MLTLNQIIKRLNDLATAHRQINTFFFGDPMDALHQKENSVYPVMIADIENGEISLEAKLTSFNLKLFFIDMVEADDSNLSEVLSDQSQTAEDILTQLKYLSNDFDWQISNATIDKVRDNLEDEIAGWSVDMTIKKLFNPANKCQLPSEYEYPTR